MRGLLQPSGSFLEASTTPRRSRDVVSTRLPCCMRAAGASGTCAWSAQRGQHAGRSAPPEAAQRGHLLTQRREDGMCRSPDVFQQPLAACARWSVTPSTLWHSAPALFQSCRHSPQSCSPGVQASDSTCAPTCGGCCAPCWPPLPGLSHAAPERTCSIRCWPGCRGASPGAVSDAQVCRSRRVTPWGPATAANATVCMPAGLDATTTCTMAPSLCFSVAMW